MPRAKTTSKNIGHGAKCSVQYKYLHPGRIISSTFLNFLPNDRLDNLLVQRRDKKIIRSTQRDVIVFRHPDHDNLELYCCERYVRVYEEGSPEHFFDKAATSTNNAVATHRPTVAGVTTTTTAPPVMFELPDGFRNFSNNNEDINIIRGLGLDVDDDNEPVPENLPSNTNPNDPRQLRNDQSWGFSGLDPRKVLGIPNNNPTMKNLNVIAMQGMTFFDWFIVFMGWPLITIVMNATNVKLGNDTKRLLDRGEFLRFIGLLLLMSCIGGAYKRSDYWSSVPPNLKTGAPYRFHEWMSGKRFEIIMSMLHFTDEDAPAYEDSFWVVRKMIRLWNENMSTIFNSGWLTCLDESMSIWFSKWTCPGWVFCPRKPHPFGNEYHSICDVLSGIMFGIEMVEGKDRPRELSQGDTDAHGPTCGLLLRLCQSLYNTGKVVILDSGFCVLQAILELKKKGVYASALIKKRRFWPKHVPGDAIEERMSTKQLGDTDCIKGNLDGIDYNYFVVKDKDYCVKLMATYGSDQVKPNQKVSRRYFKATAGNASHTTKTFKYTEPFDNYYIARHSVDDHNNYRHSVPSIEGTIKTNRWAVRVFSFLLAISEVNAFLAYCFFVCKPAGTKPPKLHDFRRKLAIELINNHYITQDDSPVRNSSRKRHREITHLSESAPVHAKKFCSMKGKWEIGSKQPYQRYACTRTNCSNRTRNYCVCAPGVWICRACHPIHVAAEVTDEIMSS